eukprot:6214716-Pleurochrysis_carterae.AAC.1
MDTGGTRLYDNNVQRTNNTSREPFHRSNDESLHRHENSPRVAHVPTSSKNDIEPVIPYFIDDDMNTQSEDDDSEASHASGDARTRERNYAYLDQDLIESRSARKNSRSPRVVGDDARSEELGNTNTRKRRIMRAAHEKPMHEFAIPDHLMDDTKDENKNDDDADSVAPLIPGALIGDDTDSEGPDDAEASPAPRKNVAQKGNATKVLKSSGDDGQRIANARRQVVPYPKRYAGDHVCIENMAFFKTKKVVREKMRSITVMCPFIQNVIFENVHTVVISAGTEDSSSNTTNRSSDEDDDEPFLYGKGQNSILPQIRFDPIHAIVTSFTDIDVLQCFPSLTTLKISKPIRAQTLLRVLYTPSITHALTHLDIEIHGEKFIDSRDRDEYPDPDE